MPPSPPRSLAAPPRAPRRPHRLVAHGDVRVDDWYWLRDRTDPAVTAYLEAENAYTKAVMAPTEALQSRLYDELRSRIQETDLSAPARKGPWWYYTRTLEGQQYGIHCRRPDPDRGLDALSVLAAAERDARGGAGDPVSEVILDENALAAGSDYFALGVFDVSPDHTLLAYAVDLTGAERYTLRFRDLATGVDLGDEIDGVYYSSAWAADSRTLFYVRPDEAVRPFQVWRHTVGRPASEDALVLQEDDERFFVQVGLTHSERYVLLTAASKVTTEVRY
ncbi:MAG TPA: hypothetical protein VKQ71_04360, partial [Acidimicrobiales bacterium]|nr:hypothetical protein [Acidimicrobiales bacterium]